MDIFCLRERMLQPAGRKLPLTGILHKTGNRILRDAVVLLLFYLSLSVPGDILHAGDREETYVYANAPWPPRIISGEKSGGMSGIDIEIIKEIARAADFKVRFLNTPWKRSLMMMQRGEAHIISSCQKKPDREKYMHFLEPPYIANSTKAFYLLRGEENRIRHYEDVYGLTVGVNLGYRYFPRFDSDEKIEKHTVRTDGQLVTMLLHDRIDTFIGTEMIIDYLLINGGYEKKIVRAPYSFSDPAASYIAISKASGLAKKLPELQRIMGRMAKEGTTERIIRDYFTALREKAARDIPGGTDKME